MSEESKNALTPVGEVLAGALSRLLVRGRGSVGRAAEAGRIRLELRQIQKDRDAFWIRLGKTAYHLVGDGEIEDHPALRKAIERIDALEQQVAELQGRSDLADEDS
ncbi:MAG: hypothetical protein KC912_06670 [Proteobacteria bacterium]|nr:hypothetical protein [Pseudomonadota bacterium]